MMETLESRQYLSATPTIGGQAATTAGALYTLDLNSTGGTPTSWTINWGDGASGSPDVQTVSGNLAQTTHTYDYSTQADDISAVANYSGTSVAANCQVLNSSGGVISSSGSSIPVAVAAAPPDATISGNATAAENSVYTLNLSAISPTYNQGYGSITSWTVNWGDGQTQTYSQSSTFNPAWATVTHTYTASSGVFEISASASVGSTNYNAAPVDVTVNAGAQTSVTASAGENFDVGDLDGTGSVLVGTGVSISATRVREDSLTIDGTVTIDSAPQPDDVPDVSVVNSLALATDTGGAFLGTLNLQNNALIIQCTSASNEVATYDMVYSALASGYNQGAWNGTGISSSAAANDPTHSTALGAIMNDGLYTTYQGHAVNEYAVIIAYTKIGDTNLDGMVNSADYLAVTNNFGRVATWATGDFTYAGTDTAADFLSLANNFGAIMNMGTDPDNSSSPQYVYSFLGDSSNPASDYTTSINWGDGTAATSGAIVADGDGIFHIVGSHVYSSAGTYTLNVSVTELDNNTSWTSASMATVGQATSGLGTSVTAPALPNISYSEPSPNPNLPSSMDTFTPPVSNVAVSSDAPIIATADSIGGPNNSIAITGSNFTAPGNPDPYDDTVFYVYGQTDGSNGSLIEAQIQDITANGATITLSSALPSDSLYFVWAVNNGGPGGQEVASAPIAINQTQATWVGTPGEVLTASGSGQTLSGYLGQTVSVYGNNLSNGAATPQSWVYLQPTSGGAGAWATVTSVNPYQVQFTVPSSLTVGDTYQIWINNGLGGQYSWSLAPTTLTVSSAGAPSWNNSTIISVTSYGANGNGVANNLTAIQNAINALQPGDTLYFPAGTYVVNYSATTTPLMIPAGLSDIRVLGASNSTSTIMFEGSVPNGTNSYEIGEAEPNQGPAGSPAVVGMGGIEFDQLAIEYSGNSLNNPSNPSALISISFRSNITFNNVTLFAGPLDALNLQSSTQITIENSTIIGQAVSLYGASNAFINNDQFFSQYEDNAIDAQMTHNISVTNCTVQNYDDSVNNPSGWGGGRLFYMTPPSYNEYLADNTTIAFGADSNLYAGGGVGSGEEVLSEGGVDEYFGAISSATANTITFTTSTAPTNISLGASVIIVAGTGLGQMETVSQVTDTDNSGTYTVTLTLSGNWNDLPAASSAADPSTIEVVLDVYNSVFYGNTLQDQTGANGAAALSDSSGFEFFDGAYNIVLADNTTDNLISGVFLSSYDNNNPTDFIQIIGNQFENSLGEGLAVASGFNNSSNSSPDDVGIVIRGNTISGSPIGINVQRTPTASKPTFTIIEQNTIDVANTSSAPVSAGLLACTDPNVLVYQNTFNAPSGGIPAPAILYTDGSASAILLRDNTYQNYGADQIYASTTEAMPASTLAVPYNVLYATAASGSSTTLVIPLLDNGWSSISWSAASNESWASLQSTNGSIASEDNIGATELTISTLGLDPGTYFANITFSADGIATDMGIWLTVS